MTARVEVAGVPGPFVDESSGAAVVVIDPSTPPMGLPPGDVLRVMEAGRVSFPRIEMADRHELYRGSLLGLQLGEGANCLDRNASALEHLDAERPTDGLGWYYLVTGAGCAGRGPLGSDSLGTPREPAAPCP